MWVWASINPGMAVSVGNLMTMAPDGTAPAPDPTLVIRSPVTTMTASLMVVPVPVMAAPNRNAVTRGCGANATAASTRAARLDTRSEVMVGPSNFSTFEPALSC